LYVKRSKSPIVKQFKYKLMKNLKFISLLCVNLIIYNFANAQVIFSNNCTSVSVTQLGAIAKFDTGDLYISGYNGCMHYPAGKNNPCNITTGACPAAETEFQLMRVATGGDVVVMNWTKNRLFTNLVHGTYYVNQRSPELKVSAECPKPLAFNSVGQQVGFIGRWAFSKSNVIPVGATVQSDVNWNFTGTSPFGSNAEIKMDVSNTKNYDIWWLGIFEIGGKNRSWANGWTAGSIPSDPKDPKKQIIDLKKLGSSSPFTNGNFQELPVKYTVQFAIAVQQCNTVWTNLNRDFSICPASLGCRSDEDQAIILSPNPASNTFKLHNIDISAESQTKVFVTDISGRTVKAFEVDGQDDFDISDLNSGLYLVSVMNNGGRIFTTKLSVSK
jgi:Secretion system C-terminal sorting domain